MPYFFKLYPRKQHEERDPASYINLIYILYLNTMICQMAVTLDMPASLQSQLRNIPEGKCHSFFPSTMEKNTFFMTL